MDQLALAELWRLGPVVTLLLGAVWYFHQRDKRNDDRAELRHKACEDRNVALGERIKSLEDRQFEQLTVLSERGVAGLAAATAAIRRSLGDDVTPPEPLPSLRIPHPSDR